MKDIDTEIQTRNRLVQLSVPDDVVREIDRLAHRETISRAAFIRRMLIGVTRGLNNEAVA